MPSCRDGEVRQQLLRVSNLGSAEDEVFTTSYGGNVSMGAVTEAEARELCASAHTHSDVPLVIMGTSGGRPSLFHTLGSQLLPLYAALVRFDMQHVKFKTVFVSGWPGVQGEHESKFLGVYEAVSGGLRPDALEDLPDVVCAETVIVGIEPQHLFPFDSHARLDYTGRHRWAPVLFSGYVDWVLSAYRLEQPDVSDEDAPERGLVLIVTRTAGHSRQLGGSSALAEHARARGWRVRTVDAGALSIREQLEAVLTASIFVSVHGSAMTLAAFLPARAVAVELMPVGFGVPGNCDAYFGFANWLDVASVSHIVWHDQQGMRDPFGGAAAGASAKCGKQAHVLLDNAAMVEVFGSAEKVWQTHPRDRQSTVSYLNGPQKCAGTSKS